MDTEIELAHYIRFEKGFSNWHVTWPFSKMITRGAKTTVTSRFSTSIPIPGEEDRIFSLLWEMQIDNDIRWDETRWVGLSCVSALANPVPVLYRMVLFKEKSGVRLQWGCLKVFESSDKMVEWQEFASPEEIAMVKESDLSLHLFLSIPISVCDVRSGSVPRPMFMDEPSMRRMPRTLKDHFAEINIDGVDPAIMEDMLRFIYTGCMPYFDDSDRQETVKLKVLKLAMAAEKFELDALKTYCLSKLLFHFCGDKDRIEQMDVIGNSLSPLKAVCLEQLAILTLCGGKDKYFLGDHFAPIANVALDRAISFYQTITPQDRSFFRSHSY